MSERIRVGGKWIGGAASRSVPLGPMSLIARAEMRPGGWLLVEWSDGRVERARVHRYGAELWWSVGGELWWGTHESEADRLTRASGAGGAGAAADDGLVVAFPGRVRQVCVSEGERVVAGQPLVLLEAMKMEFTLRAPRDGRVQRLLAVAGAQVMPGDRLVDLE